MNITTIGIDLAKNVFQLHGVDAQGQSIVQKKITRHKLSEFIANISPYLIGLEACGGSPLLGPKIHPHGSSSQTHEPSICQTLREIQQK